MCRTITSFQVGLCLPWMGFPSEFCCHPLMGQGDVTLSMPDAVEEVDVNHPPTPPTSTTPKAKPRAKAAKTLTKKRATEDAKVKQPKTKVTAKAKAKSKASTCKPGAKAKAKAKSKASARKPGAKALAKAKAKATRKPQDWLEKKLHSVAKLYFCQAFVYFSMNKLTIFVYLSLISINTQRYTPPRFTVWLGPKPSREIWMEQSARHMLWMLVGSYLTYIVFTQSLDGSFGQENKKHQPGFWTCSEPLQVDYCEWSTWSSCGAQTFDFSWAHDSMMPTNLTD